ncbi:MAG TPA: membrane protein insertase YidC [Symbiobacteriaceae bacterium]|nr:membrane protein insertase YidC [Symbiobacteriaceae bacterium]
MSFLTSGIHAALEALFHLTGNYGWTILLLTLAVRLAMLPLALWQQRAARASATLQTEALEIQKRYAGEEAQKRLQELYGRSGGTMLAGCLPALLQWPVFMAMYGALNSFAFAVPAAFLWLENLAAPDPYFILPLLAVATSVWQTWAGTPKAQRLTMLLLPILFGFFMLKASAAVALYWVSGNLISFAQTYLLKRHATA